MNFRALQAFVEVVRQGGFSQAGKTIHATQSTVSKAVRQLEDELGAVLLDRSDRNTLTAAGEIVYRRALTMLAERDDLITELDELRGLKRGVLRLGLPPIGSNVLFAPAFAAYRSLHPDIDIRLVEHGSKRLEELLLAGELEIAASLLPVAEDFEWQDVRCEPIVALLPPSHPATDGSAAALSDLAAQPFILFESGFALNQIILDACARRGFTPEIAVRSSQIDFIVELVATGMGVGFLPRMIAEQRRNPAVRLVPIDDEQMEWHMALVWRRGAYLSHAAKAWLELARLRGAAADSPPQ
ncbi:LysR family transcriptional regulator [Phyllobacterium phragmitis]|uniref:LysR family transcriptional regulator n=1 Tax=Phyllobacterium phragmitis TaxID=2670329 RepID=A0ABQ0GW82_9HYPH